MKPGKAADLMSKQGAPSSQGKANSILTQTKNKSGSFSIAGESPATTSEREKALREQTAGTAQPKSSAKGGGTGSPLRKTQGK